MFFHVNNLIDSSIIYLLQSVMFFVVVVVNCGAKKQPPSTSTPTPQPQDMPKPVEPPKPTDKKGEEEVNKAESKPNERDKMTETPDKEKPEDSLDALKPKTREANRAKDIGNEKVANKGDYKTMAILDSPALGDDVSINDMGKDKQKPK